MKDKPDYSKLVVPVKTADGLVIGYTNKSNTRQTCINETRSTGKTAITEVWKNEYDLCFDHIISNNGKHPCIVGKKGGLFDNVTSDLIDIRDFIERVVTTERSRVIDCISFNEGWEETGDKYRKFFNLPEKYSKPSAPLKVKKDNEK